MRFTPRKYLRFSVSTLILLVTVLCVWLGVQANRARNTRLAIDAVEDLGGQVRYVHEWPKNGGYDPQAKLPGPTWLRELVGEEYFVDVATIIFWGNQITDDDLEEH